MVSLCICADFIEKFRDNLPEYKSEVFNSLEKAEIEPYTLKLLYEAAEDIFGLYRYASTNADDYAEKNPYYSKYHYIRLFNSKLGLTPHKYRLQCRIRETQKLLQNGYSSAAAAAEKEFYDQSHFIKCFKTVVGITPSEYKNSVRNFLQDEQKK